MGILEEPISRKFTLRSSFWSMGERTDKDEEVDSIGIGRIKPL